MNGVAVVRRAGQRPAPPGFWPFGIAVAVAVAAGGIAVSQWWLASVGAITALLAPTGLLLEFYAGAPESP